jgi:hypothetical protein
VLVVLLSNGSDIMNAFSDAWLLMALAGLATGLVFVAGVGAHAPAVAPTLEPAPAHP